MTDVTTIRASAATHDGNGLRAFAAGLRCPRPLLKQAMHLEPDFAYLTYGDVGDRRARLRTLILIRWVAIVGQAFTVSLVYVSLEFPLPLPPLLGAIALSALINVALTIAFTPTTRLTERSVALSFD